MKCAKKKPQSLYSYFRQKKKERTNEIIKGTVKSNGRTNATNVFVIGLKAIFLPHILNHIALKGNCFTENMNLVQFIADIDKRLIFGIFRI